MFHDGCRNKEVLLSGSFPTHWNFYHKKHRAEEFLLSYELKV